jgi:phosphoglycolate phosphatase-like HAD superfamily hydrolase
MKKLFVWDFHGTLEKGNELAVIEVTNNALEKHGFTERLNKEDAFRLYGIKWYEYFEYLLPDESHETHVMLQHTCFEWPNVFEIIGKYLQPNDHALTVLSSIKKAGHDQILISNTSVDALPQFVSLARMEEFFDTNNTFAVMAHTKEVKRTKRHVLEEYLTAQPFSYDQIISIGDSLKDIALADDVQSRAFLYRHPGLNTEKYLEEHVLPIADLREILTAV